MLLFTNNLNWQKLRSHTTDKLPYFLEKVINIKVVMKLNITLLFIPYKFILFLASLITLSFNLSKVQSPYFSANYYKNLNIQKVSVRRKLMLSIVPKVEIYSISSPHLQQLPILAAIFICVQ